MRKNVNYINNKEFLDNLIEYKKLCDKSKMDGNSRPPIPECIGTSFLKIAEHLSKRPNFIGYTYREDMIGDAIENCVIYVDKFDPKKSNNPFSYFTQVCFFAFLRRIGKEKKQTYIKESLLNDSDLFDGMIDTQDNDFRHYTNLNMEEAHRNFDKVKINPKKKSPLQLKRVGVELFYQEED